MSADTSAWTNTPFHPNRILRPLLLFSFLLIILALTGPWEGAEGEDVAFYQAGGFGGCHKNTHYDGEHLYVTHYQGMSIFDISDPDNPEEIGFVLTNGYAYGLWVDGNHAYIGNGYESLVVVDISDRTDPFIVGEIANEWFASGVFVLDDYAYVADGYFQSQDEGGLLIYDVSDPTTPRQEGKLSTPQGGPNDVVVIDDYAYVANGQDGLLIADVSNKAAPYRVGSYDTSYACDLAILDNYAYVADRGGGLVIIDHSIKQVPMQVGSYDTDGEAWGIELVGDYAYVADFDNGLVIIDVSNPNLPVQVGRLDTADQAMKVSIVGDRAYVADNRNGLVVADVSIVANPQETGHFDTAGFVLDVELADGYVYVCDGSRLFILEASDVTYPRAVGFYDAAGTGAADGIHVAVQGDYAYLANGEAGLVILDISDKTDPQQVGQYDTDDLAVDIFVEENYAYVADQENGLVIIDVSNPVLPREVGHYDTDDFARRILVEDGLAYVGDRFNGLLIIDVSNPAAPSLVGHYELEGGGHVNGIALSGDYAYLSVGSDGLIILDISDKSNPQEVGNYPTEGWAMLGVNVIGHHALLGDNVNGVVIVNVSDPENPEQEFHYKTPDSSSVIEVLGNYAFVADRYNGLVIGEVTGLMGGTPRAIIEKIDPSPAYTDELVTFEAGASGGSGSYDRYEWRSNLDGELYGGPDEAFTHEGFTTGNHTIYLKVRDNEGTWSYEERSDLTIGHRPEVEVESPEDGSQVEGEAEITGIASDEDGDETIEAVEVSVDDGEWEEVNGTSDWDHTWDTTEVENGEHTLTFRCRDDIGYSHEVTLTLTVANEVENTPPEVTITSPEDGEEVDGSITIEGTASDEDGDGTIEKVELSLDADEWIEVSGTTSWSYELDTMEMENGEHTIEVRAYDSEEYSNVVSITLNVLNEVENRAPEVTITSPGDGEEVDGSITIEGSASDKDGDGTIEKVELSLDAEEWVEVSGTTSWSYELETTDLENGEHTIGVRAFDGEEYSDVVSISLNVLNEEPNQIPTITILTPIDNGTVSGLVSLSVRAEDEDGEVETVEFSLDGSTWQPLTGSGVWLSTWDSETMSDGVYRLRFRAFDGEDHSNVAVLTVMVENSGGGSDNDSGFDENIILGGGVLAVVVIVVAVLFVVRDRREEGEEPCPDCGTGLEYIEEYESWYCSECEEYKE